MTWIIIIGLISFILQIYVLKHTYSYRTKGDILFDWKEAEKIGIPLWAVLIMLFNSIIPFINIAETIIFWAVWLKFYSNPDGGAHCGTWYTYWRFKDNFFSRKI